MSASVGFEAQKPSKTISRARSYATAAILFSVNLINYMDRYTLAANLKQIQQDFNIGDSMGGLLQTVFVVAYMIFAPAFGYLGDRYSRKVIMCVGITIWLATVLACTFVPIDDFWAFMLCRCIVGIGEASYSTISPTIIADLFSKDMRSRMLMVFYFAIPLGGGLGFAIGGSVGSATGSWRWGLRVTPVIGAILMIFILLIVPDPERGQADQSHVKSTSAIKDIKELLKIKSYILCTIGQIAVTFSTGSLSFWGATFVEYANLANGKPEDEAGVSFVFGAIVAVSGFVGVALGTAISQYWRRRNLRADAFVCAIGLIVSGPFMYAGLTTTLISLPASYVFIFIGVTALSTNWAINADIIMYIVVPNRRSLANAIQILISHLFGDASSPYIVGQMSESLLNGQNWDEMHYYSLQHSMYLMPFISVIGGFFYLTVSWFIVADRKRASATGIVPSDTSGTLAVIGTTGSPPHPFTRSMVPKVGTVESAPQTYAQWSNSHETNRVNEDGSNLATDV